MHRRTEGINFLAWLIEDVNDVHAEVGSPRDEQMKEYVGQGFLRHYLTANNENSYEIVRTAPVLEELRQRRGP